MDAPPGDLVRPRTKKRRGDDADPIRSPVGLWAGVDDDGIREILAELIAQPAELLDVGVGDRLRELHLNCEHTAVGPFDDDVDLVYGQSKEAGVRPCVRTLVSRCETRIRRLDRAPSAK